MNARVLTATSNSDFLADERPMLIGGKWQGSVSGKTFPVYNPATGEVIANVAEGDKADVDLAVAAAGTAFRDRAWRYMPPSQRARLLWRLADLVEENAEEFAELETLNQGKPMELARHLDIPVVCEAFRYFAGWCTKIEGTTNNLSLPDLRGEDTIGPTYHAYTLREPVGVVGLIVPWNFPLLMASTKLGPALAVGCTCILKPAEETPLTALRLGELIAEAGFPEGVVNIVTGYGHTAGAAISAHPDVDKVAFTGSTEVGKLIAQAATGNLKKVSLELGGKSPAVVFADADLDIAIKGAASSIFLNTGQVCFAGSRLLVEKQVYDQVVDGVAEIASNIKVGAGQDPESEMGPVISSKQLERICGYIEQGVTDGAEVVTGGERDGEQGYFIKPTVMVGVDSQAAVVREEIFGPVLSIQSFDDLAGAEEMANDTCFGLGASIWTRDISKAHRLAAEIQAGTIWINSNNMVDISIPFGGYKQSGWGRENGKAAIDLFTETKSVIAAL
jgi:phenylacetaldehyde dehydrogenase